MPGRGGKSCGRAFWGDHPHFAGLPKPQWAAVGPPSHRAWGPMRGDTPPQFQGCPRTSQVYQEHPLRLGVTPDPFGVQHQGVTPRPPLFSQLSTTPRERRRVPELGSSAGRSQPA